MAKWNRRSLIRACEDLIAREDCIVELGGITDPKVSAHAVYDVDHRWKPSDIRFRIDPSKSSLIEGLLHEALHVVVGRDLGGFNPGLDEVLVQALERELWVKGFKREDIKRWKGLIERKLA